MSDEGVVFTLIGKNGFADSPEADPTLWFIANQESIFTLLSLIAPRLKHLSVLDMMMYRLNTLSAKQDGQNIHIDRLASLLLKEQNYYGREIDRDLDKVARLSAELILQHIADRILLKK